MPQQVARTPAAGPVPLWCVIGWACIVIGLMVWSAAAKYEAHVRLHQGARQRLVNPFPAREAA